MNFLAHLYLSGDSHETMVGNFIGDFVKGRNYTEYAELIQQGIKLHREIDAYTDQHPVNQRIRHELWPHFGHYSGVVLDLYWDHFLANLWTTYHPANLESYTQEVYRILNNHWTVLPPGVQRMLPYMEKDNWLLSYGTIKGISQALNGISRRAKFESNMEKGGEVLSNNYEKLQEGFREFLPDLQDYARVSNPFFTLT